MTLLHAHLSRWLSQEFSYSDRNCAFVAADWIKVVRGVDPAADDRHLFSDQAGCQRATRYFSDPVACVGARMDRYGIPRGNDLRPGDVGVVRLPGMACPIVAIWAGTAWVYLPPQGAGSTRGDLVEVLAFWSVGYDPEVHG